jgi:hypothetical protein
MKTPLEKSIVGVVQIHDETIVIIDEDRLNREVLKGSIADETVQKLLPFQTYLSEGTNHIHITNASAYVVETNAHRIVEGETLCARARWTPRIPYVNRREVPTCPGCLAKAKTLIVYHLLATEPELG